MTRRLFRSLFSLLLVCSSPLAGFSAEPASTYQGTVVGEDVEVRCGPGAQFYVTGKLKMNDLVTVRRHDHGGWYMIDPPAGSFSWIDATLVDRVSPERGVVAITPEENRLPRAIVRIGSEFSEEHSFSGRELFNGDEVTILGEQTLRGPRGAVRMLKIAPPAQEFRWVKGEFIVPNSKQIQQQLAVDPFQVPAEHRQRLVTENRSPLLSPATATDEKVAEAAPAELPTTPSQKKISDEFDLLSKIDQDYSDMVAKPASEWVLDPIIARYEQLKASASPQIVAMIDQRMPVVQKRQEIAGHYQRFLKVAAETSERDAQLLGTQASFQQAEAPVVENPQPAMAMPLQETPRMLSPAAATSHPIAPASATQPAASPTGKSKFSGAGMVQQVLPTPGLPPYVLVAPDGRFLAFLKPAEGVAMDEWIGKAAAMTGPRAFDNAVGGDVIQVESVSAVQLTK
ncbi:SH3 domain-containing protein [Planctomicrobium sp. SH664]|uniref:SH3 domain-containing protein n=1 Tax=Planctomicrobium sp. SH664 TaxID=3448125 RepID=UPI003F5C391F